MQHQEFEPPEELRDTIKCFWYNRKDFGEVQSSFEVQPDGYAEIIFHFGSACSICLQWKPAAIAITVYDGAASISLFFFIQKTV